MRSPLTRLLVACAAGALFLHWLHAAPVWQGASWVWDDKVGAPGADSGDTRYLRRVFQLAGPPAAAEIHITADNQYTLHVNGQRVGSDGAWEQPEKYDVTKLLRQGANVIAVEARNAGGPAAVIAWLKVTGADGKETVVGTDASWLVSLTKEEGWEAADFDDSLWAPAVELGGADVGPWNLARQGGGAEPKVNSVADRSINQYQPADEEAKHFVLPAGYTIRLVVGEPTIINPVCIALDEQDRLYVSESHTYRYGPNGSPVKPYTNPIVRLDPLPGGQGYRRHLVAEGFEDPVMGMAIRDGQLWATANNYLYRFDLQEDGPATGKTVLVEDKHKAWNPFGMFVLEWGPDGKLYMSVGNHDIDLRGPDGKLSGRGPSGIVVRMNPDGTGMERLVHGLRVPYSFEYDPFGQLWLLSNGQGNPDRFVRVIDGVDYHCFSRGAADNAWLAGEHPLAPPCFELPRGASTQLLRYYGAAYPEEIQGSLLLNNWGAHGFHAPDRTIFRYVPDRRNDIGLQEPWVTCRDPHFRSSHILLAPDGDLLIADWYGRDDESDVTGRVWRVSYTGKDAPKVEHTLASPRWADRDYALSALGSPSHVIREKAVATLAACGPTAAEALGRHAGECREPLGAAGAVWALARLGDRASLRHLTAAAGNPDWRVRRLAANVARRYDPEAGAAVAAALAGDNDPAVRVEAALAQPTPEKTRESLVAALAAGAAADPHLRYEAAWHLARLADSPTLLKLLRSADAGVRLAGLIAIDVACYEGFDTRPMAQEVLARALAEPGDLDMGLLLTLARLNADPSLVAALRQLQERDDIPLSVSAQAILVLRSIPGGGGAELGEAAEKRFLQAVRQGLVKPATAADLLVLFELFESEGPSPLAVDYIGRNLTSRDVRLSEAAHRLARSFGPEAAALSGRIWAELLADNKKTRAADALALLGTLAKVEREPDPAKWARLLADDRQLVVRDAVRTWRAFVDHKGMKEVLLREAPGLARRQPALRADLAAVLKALGFGPQAIAGAGLAPGDTSHENLRKLVAAAGANKGGELLGRRVFERSACVRCHTTTRDSLLGPSLRGVGKDATTEYLLEALLEPSRTIKTGYLTEAVVTRDGTIVSGIVSDGPGNKLRVANAEREVLLDRAAVVERVQQKQSIMPEGQEQELSPAEFVDLVRYLQSLR